MLQWGDLLVIGGAAIFEQQVDVAFQRRLVALNGEVIIRLLLDDIGSYRPLSQKGVAGDVLSGDVAGFQQRDGHADFVGAFLFLTAFYRQGSHFFWA